MDSCTVVESLWSEGILQVIFSFLILPGKTEAKGKHNSVLLKSGLKLILYSKSNCALS